MKKPFLIITLFFALIALAGCQSRCDQGTPQRKWLIPNGKLKVLSTTAMIHDIARSVGGRHVDGNVLICGELDPHTYQLVKGDDEKLAFADIIFHNGLGLEHGPSLQYYLSDSEKAVGVGDDVKNRHPEEIIFHQGQLDPHIWMDISLWAKTIEPIVAALSRADPQNSQEYRQNGKKLYDELLKVHSEVQAILSEVPDHKRYLVTSHDAFNYFARAYLATEKERAQNRWQDRFEAPEGLAPESQISTKDIQLIIDHLQKYEIHVLFPESNVSKDSIRKIVSAGNEKGLNLMIAKEPLYGDAMGGKDSGADTYQTMILHNAKTLRSYLK